MTEKPQQDPSSRRAVALRYDGRNAPRVSATGRDGIAEQIIAIAREHRVPLFENPELIRLLAELELGEEIPEVLYRCIAQIIAFAYSIQGRTPPGWESGEQGFGTQPAEVPVAPLLPPPPRD